jgi:hypothetical protein
MDQYLNDTGVCVDVQAVRNAAALVASATEEGNKELFQLTGGLIDAGTKREAIKKYLETKGVKLPNLQKATVKDAITKAGGDNLRILQLRQQLSLTSNAKYAAFLATTSPDGRIRDLLVYHGASTGRWSGKLVQIQNLVKAAIKPHEISAAIHVLTSSPGAFASCYDVLPTLSSCIRGMLIPSPGHTMFITDFAAIEARVVMWLAGEEKGLRAFAKKDADPSVDDIYVLMAKQISPTATRQLGKQTVLGCLAEDSLVYSDTGLTAIQNINRGQRIWNGEKWVNFRELVDVGEKNVIRIGDLWLTPDHRLLTNQGWRTAAEIVLSGDTRHHLSGKYLGGGQLQVQNTMSVLNAVSLSAVNAALNQIEESTNFGGALLELAPVVARVSKDSLAADPVSTWISCLILACENGGRSAGTIFDEGVATKVTPTSRGMVLEGFESVSNRVEYSWNTLLRLMGGGLGVSLSIELIMPKGTSEEIFDSLRKEKTITTKVKRCWDLADVEGGRFQAEGYIAHNCGFGMGVQKFIDTCAKYEVAVTPQLAERAVGTYRKLFSRVPKFWYSMEDAARGTIVSGKPHGMFFIDGDFLRMRLPSGRTIVYHHPRVDAEGSVSFMAVNSITNKYEREQIWGGKLVENAVQATARDLMVAGMFGLLRAGYRILFTVHDELVVEHKTGSEQEVKEIVCRVPTWAKGCPINAECESAERYKK